MAAPRNSLRRALRMTADDSGRFALVELNAIIDKLPQSWVAYALRARINQALGRYLEAIADYTAALSRAKSISARHKTAFLQNIALCSSRLLTEQQKTNPPKRPVTAPAPPQNTAVGRIAAIGKFLLDESDKQKIGRVAANVPISEPTFRKLTVEAIEKHLEVLRKLDSQPGVIGSCMIATDGFLLASTLPGEFDLDLIRIGSFGMYLSSANITKKMGHDQVQQIVMRTPKGFILIQHLSDGMLITVSKDQETSNVLQLMRKVSKLNPA